MLGLSFGQWVGEWECPFLVEVADLTLKRGRWERVRKRPQLYVKVGEGEEEPSASVGQGGGRILH